MASWLAHPLTAGLDIDAPETTALRARLIRERAFLRRIYEEWYGLIAAAIPAGDGRVVELGAGAGFLGEVVPRLITTDVLPLPSVNTVLDAQALPFAADSLRAIAMTNVLHHLGDAERFFAEAARCVRPGGVLAMVEPWSTPWSRLVYRRFHHEPFEPGATDWRFSASGPLSDANGALPWIVFHRDRERFRLACPQWAVRAIRPLMPFRYLLSGGVSRRGLMPGWSFGFWRTGERLLAPAMNALAMFAFIVVERTAGRPWRRRGRSQPARAGEVCREQTRR